MTEAAPQGPMYLTPKEAGTYIRRSVSTLEEWRRTKKGPPYIKIGPGKRAGVFYYRPDLDSWMLSQRMSPEDGQ